MKYNILEKFKLSLYIILDSHFIEQRSLLTTCMEIIKGGADIIQFRDKTAEDEEFFKNASLIYDITKDNNIPLIINDRVNIALNVGADGIHLGSSDLPLSQARKILGEETIIGYSVHNIDEFNHSQEADYLGIGCIFPTKTKRNVEICGLQFMKKIRERTDKPLIGIGGINDSNYIDVINSGANGIALISAIYSSNDVVTRLRLFSDILKKRRLCND